MQKKLKKLMKNFKEKINKMRNSSKTQTKIYSSLSSMNLYCNLLSIKNII